MNYMRVSSWLVGLFLVSNLMAQSSRIDEFDLRCMHYCVDPQEMKSTARWTSRVIGLLGGYMVGNWAYKIGESLNKPVINNVLGFLNNRVIDPVIRNVAPSQAWTEVGKSWGNQGLMLSVTMFKMVFIFATATTSYFQIKNSVSALVNRDQLPPHLVRLFQEQIAALAFLCSLRAEITEMVSALSALPDSLNQVQMICMQELDELIERSAAHIDKELNRFLSGNLAAGIIDQHVVLFAGTDIEQTVLLADVLVDMHQDMNDLAFGKLPRDVVYIKCASKDFDLFEIFLQLQKTKSEVVMHASLAELQEREIFEVCEFVYLLVKGLSCEFNKQQRKMCVLTRQYQTLARWNTLVQKVTFA